MHPLFACTFELLIMLTRIVHGFGEKFESIYSTAPDAENKSKSDNDRLSASCGVSR